MRLGRRLEARGGQPADKGELELRSPAHAEDGSRPAGGPLPSRLPLEDHVGPLEASGAEQPAQDGRRSVERQVRDHAESPVRQTNLQGVGLQHRDVRTGGEAPPERGGELGIDLDGDDVLSPSGERRRQPPGTGSNVDDDVAVRDRGVANDRLGERPAPEEVLATSVSSRVGRASSASPGHGRSPLSPRQAPFPWAVMVTRGRRCSGLRDGDQPFDGVLDHVRQLALRSNESLFELLVGEQPQRGDVAVAHAVERLRLLGAAALTQRE